MRKTIGTVLLWIAGLIIALVAWVAGGMLLGIEAYMWIGGWGFLLLGMPLLTLLMLCLIIGFSLRSAPKAQVAQRAPSSLKKTVGWGLAILGAVILAYNLLNVATMMSFILGDRFSGNGSAGQVPILLPLLQLLNVTVPIGIGSLSLGIRIIRRNGGQGKPPANPMVRIEPALHGQI